MEEMLLERKTFRETKSWEEKMRHIGKVEVPQEAFLSVLKVNK